MRNYNDAIKIDPNNFVAGNNLAYILAERGTDLNTALSLAQGARKSQPENPSTADTLGWVYYKLGNYSPHEIRHCLQFPNNQTTERLNTISE